MKATQAQKTAQAGIGPLQISIAVLALATAAIHFSLLFPDVMFILNGLGYLTLLAAYFLPIPFLRQNHKLVRWAFIAFAAVTILAWIAIGDKSWPGGMMGYITKAIEVALIALLLADRRSD